MVKFDREIFIPSPNCNKLGCGTARALVMKKKATPKDFRGPGGPSHDHILDHVRAMHHSKARKV